MAGMKLKRHISMFLLIVIVGSSYIDLFSQSTQKKPTRQSSIEAFSNGNYQLAYNEFSELLLTYSKDPLYKYYLGVCLVKLESDPEKAVSLLEESLQGAAVVRTLPSDAMFYLGRAQQMAGNFVEAVGSYNTYSERIGRRTAREQGIPMYIQQCNEKKGSLTKTTRKAAEVVKNENVVVSETEIKSDVKESVQQSEDKEVPDKTPLPQDYDKILEDALDFQFKADSINALVTRQKKDLGLLSEGEIAAYKLKISKNELLAAEYQKSANQRYTEAQVAMNPENEKPAQSAVLQSSDKEIKNSISKPNVIELAKIDEPLESNNAKNADKQLDTIKKAILLASKPIKTFTVFEILPKPVTDPNVKIIVDSEVPEGLIYRIQVAVFRNPVAPVYFKGITPVYGFKVKGTDRTNYYAGIFRRYADAKKALASVKSKGFKDAFVVAFSGNKPISFDRAAILEKEWGNKPFISNVKSVPATQVDTIPPTLSFRVEVLRSLKPLEDEEVEKIRKISGKRGLDIQPLNNGSFVYLIGKFITFESAAEYADLLVRNGFREAKVGAWLGNIEIPVETARQLFENLE